MNIKRFVSVLLSATLIVTVFAGITVSADAADNNVYEARVLSSLKIIEMPDITTDWSETEITNGTFIDWALSLSPYTDELQPLKLILPTGEISKTDERYHKYAYLYSLGYLKDETGVAPSKVLKTNTALSVLKGILGYSKAAENGAAKLSIGVKNSLLKGIKTSSDGALMLNDAVKMLHNAIEMPYCDMEILSDNRINYKVSKDVTVLVKNKDIYEISGRMNATSITSVSGSTAADNKVRINETEFDITDFSLNSLIGRDVTGYAVIDGDKKEVLYLEPDSSTDDFVIDGADFVEYSPTAVKYYDNSGKLKQKIVNNPTIIYNGKRLEKGEYDDSLFNITDGDITLVKNGGKTDLVIVNRYENLVVSTVDKDGKSVSDMFRGKILSFDCDVAVLKSEGGKDFSVDALRKKNIITYLQSLDGEYVNAIVGGVYMAEEITSVSQSADGIDSIEVCSQSYDTASEFKDTAESLVVGNKYEIYINCNNRVVAIKEPSGISTNLGYVMGADVEDGLSGRAVVKMVTPDSASEDDYIVLTCAKKVTVDGTSYSGDGIVNAIKQFNGTCYVPISYKSNAEGEIYEIDTPNYAADKESDKSLMQLHSRSGSQMYVKSVITNGYRNHYGGKYYLSFDGICVNHATGSDKIIVIDRVRNDSKVNLDIYGFGTDSPLVYFAVVNASSAAVDAKFEDDLMAVKKISRKINSKENTGYFVTLTGMGMEKEMEVADEYENIVNKIDKFDLVRYKINAKNQLIAFEVVLDYFEKDKSIGYENYDWENGGEYRIVTGKVYDVLEDAGCKVSSYKNLISFYKNSDDIANSREVAFMRNAYVYKVDRDELSIEAATVDDIKTYKNYGGDADMVCMATQYAIPIVIYIIRNEK